jgi:hypothetical protein
LQSAQAQFVQEQADRDRLNQMRQLWQQSGGDIERFKQMGGYQFLTPQQSVQLENTIAAQQQAAQTAQQQAGAVALARTQTPLAPQPEYGVQPTEMAQPAGGVTPLPGLHEAQEAYTGRVGTEEQQYVQSAIQRRSHELAAATDPSGYIKAATKEMFGGGEGETSDTEFFRKIARINQLRSLPQLDENQKRELAFIEDSLKTAKIRNQQFSKEQLRAMLPTIQQMSPTEAFREGFRMKDNGQLWTDADGLPVELPSFDKKMGKRTNVKELLEIGEMRDDLVQAESLLRNPELAAQAAQLWDNEVRGMAENEFSKWLQNRGVGAFSPLGELMIRIQRVASDERKRMMGTAVTKIELESALAWLPDAGDGWPEITQKIKVAASEADERLYRWLDSFKHVANMSPFYDAFGLDRFNRERVGFTYTDTGGQPPPTPTTTPPPAGGADTLQPKKVEGGRVY